MVATAYVRHGHGPDRTIQTGVGACRGPSRQGARSACRQGSENPLQLVDPAEVGAADEEPRRFCRLSICAAFPPATFRRRSTALLGQDAPNLSPAVIARLKANGRTIIGAGRSAICRRGATFTSGRTASICRLAWKTQAECWCGRPPHGIDCARLRSCRSQAKETVRGRRLFELAWIRQSTSTNCMGSTPRRSPCCARNCAGKEMMGFFQRLPPTVIAIEACGGSHHLARSLEALRS